MRHAPPEAFPSSATSGLDVVMAVTEGDRPRCRMNLLRLDQIPLCRLARRRQRNVHGGRISSTGWDPRTPEDR